MFIYVPQKDLSSAKTGSTYKINSLAARAHQNLTRTFNYTHVKGAHVIEMEKGEEQSFLC